MYDYENIMKCIYQMCLILRGIDTIDFGISEAVQLHTHLCRSICLRKGEQTEGVGPAVTARKAQSRRAAAVQQAVCREPVLPFAVNVVVLLKFISRFCFDFC